MTTAAEILRVAASQIGYRETPTNRTKFGKWYGMDGVSWCAIFTSWVGFQASGSTALLGKYAYTPAQADHYRSIGRFYRTPKAGDLVFFNWPGDGVNRIQHVGIVEKVINSSTIQTIEGNTSPGNNGSQSNGGGVYRRTRSTSSVVGYGRPKYTNRAVAAVTNVLKPTLKRALNVGDQGSDVLALQKRLKALKFYKGALDGKFGEQTKDAVKAFQRFKHLTGDGVVGRVTAIALGWKFV